ncbi:hypothetical protein CFC21_035635, partial [Triticum aestivum]
SGGTGERTRSGETDAGRRTGRWGRRGKKPPRARTCGRGKDQGNIQSIRCRTRWRTPRRARSTTAPSPPGRNRARPATPGRPAPAR